MRRKHIVVATDLSSAAEALYRWALALARPLGARVTLFHADETSEFSWPARTLRGNVRLRMVLNEATQRRETLLGEAREHLEQHDIPTTYQAVTGAAVQQILDFCRSHKVEMLLMGRHGARQTHRFTMGGTSKRVLRRIRVPTLIVPRDADGGEQPPPLHNRRFIATTVFSAACTMALDATLELAQTLNAQVECVHVIKLPMPFHLTPASWPAMVAGETQQELEHMHAKELADLIGPERASRCTPYTVLGLSPAESLRDLALELKADLVAMPSHSTNKEHPPRFGSNTESVIKRSQVPVLVYPVSYLKRRFGPARSEA